MRRCGSVCGIVVWATVLADVLAVSAYADAGQSPTAVEMEQPARCESLLCGSPDSNLLARIEFVSGGVFITNGSGETVCWYVPANWPETATNPALYIAFDRSAVTSTATMSVQFYDFTNSSLFVDLMNRDLTLVVSNYYGDLILGSQELVRVELQLPIPESPDTEQIRLRRGAGPVAVYDVVLSETPEGIEQRSREASEGTARTRSPAAASSGRGEEAAASALAASQVVRNTSSSTLANPGGDAYAVNNVSSSQAAPRSRRTIHVSALEGDDALDGLGKGRHGSSGPKRTIQSALGLARDGDTICVWPGKYEGNASFCGVNVNVVIMGDVTLP